MLPPLELFVEITKPNGATYRWDGTSDPAWLPKGLSFRTKRGEGFADASCSLSRRIDQDYVDLNLYDDVAIVGADGSVAYEGYVGGLPRSMSSTHSVTVQTAGWMAHARDRKFQEIYVDRDLSQWHGAGVAQRERLLSFSYRPRDPSVISDSSNPAVELLVESAWATNEIPRVEAWYDAGDIIIGSLYYAWKQNNANAIGFDWNAGLAIGDTEIIGTDVTADLEAAGPSTGTLTATAANRTAAFLKFLFATNTAGGAAGGQYRLFWTCLAVYGNHGLVKRGTEDAITAKGFYASDVIKDIARRWCPELSTAGVMDTSYVISHLAYRDPTDPYDAFLDVNKYHLWDLAVWENKTLHFQPFDLTDYTWQVRLSDPGVEVDLQGDSSDQLANGIAVTFLDVQRNKTRRITPDQYPELADTSLDNPVNQAGRTIWTEYQLSAPSTVGDAVQIGRVALAAFNEPKAAGTITVRGHIKDRAGHWSQVWKVRQGDTISIADHPNSRPRLVVETDYDHDSKTLRIATDSPFKKLDAFLDRVGTAIDINTVAP